jgi:hypothetical protein
MGRGRVEKERAGGGAKWRVGFNGEVKKCGMGAEVRQREEKMWDERETEQLWYN